MLQVMKQWCKHEIKVTYLGKKTWGVRCFTNDILNQEIRVGCREDIGVAAREMLRWEDKCGNWSDFAIAARKRKNTQPLRGYRLPSRVVKNADLENYANRQSTGASPRQMGHI